MPRQAAPEDEKRLVWDRIKRTAQQYHDHPQDHGIVSRVAQDAGVTAQSAQGWKEARTRPSMKYLTRLAALYGVSGQYLAGHGDDPSQAAPVDEGALRTKMVELVEDVISELNPKADPRLVTRMCKRALEMLKDGADEDTVTGALFRMMRNADDKADAKARGADEA